MKDVFLIPNELVASILIEAENQIRVGLNSVYKRKGIEAGMRQVYEGFGGLKVARSLIKNQCTVDVNINIKK